MVQEWGSSKIKHGLLGSLLILCFCSTAQVKESVYSNRAKPYEEGTLFASEDPQTITQHQNLLSLGWVKGNLIYEGRSFQNVDMNYNIYEDILLVLSLQMNIDGVKALEINQDKVNQFLLGGRTFIQYTYLQNPPIQSGFYEVFFEGEKVRSYIKHSKRKSVTKNGIEYEDQKRIFFLFQGRYHEFKSMQTLYNLLPQHKKEIKLYLKQDDLRISKRRFEGLRAVLEYCDQLVGDES